MARYATLIRFTCAGVDKINKSTERAAAFAKAAAKTGVKVETQLWTTGAFDGVIVLSGPEEKILQCLAQLASQGNVRTETLRAFDANEFKQITG